MDGLLKVLEERIGDIVTVIVFGSLGFAVYMFSKEEKIKDRLKKGASGFFIAMTFGYPAWLALGNGKWWALALIVSILAISGQFLPELITATFKKYATNVSKKIGGE